MKNNVDNILLIDFQIKNKLFGVSPIVRRHHSVGRNILETRSTSWAQERLKEQKQFYHHFAEIDRFGWSMYIIIKIYIHVSESQDHNSLSVADRTIASRGLEVSRMLVDWKNLQTGQHFFGMLFNILC